MNPKSSINRNALRGIIIVYLLLFATALVSSGYLFTGVVSLRPIPLVGLLKYLLLCVLFLILGMDAIKALSLKPLRIGRLAGATKNFKWLFTIATLICLAAKTGLFNIVRDRNIQVSYIQITALVVLTAFCFWSDSVLSEEECAAEEQTEEKI